MGSAGAWWTQLPRGRVVYLAGAAIDALTVTLDPLPVDAPAIVTCRPTVRGSQAALVAEILDLLHESAVRLFPTWLPGWDAASGPAGAGGPAVRALALELAGRSDHFGPFLADLAVGALTGHTSSTSVPPESRAAGLTRVLAASYGQPDVVMIVDLPVSRTGPDEQILVAAAEWLAYQGNLAGVWLVGTPLTAVDWIAAHQVRLPVETQTLVVPPVPPAAPVLGLPPLAGKPRLDSPAEQLLEKVLATRPWATGRTWNQSFPLGSLTNGIRIDLLWDAERLAVEVDGPEHWQRAHYAADRARDVRLQADGYAVLRFTNDQILDDVTGVTHRLEQFLTARRVPGRPEGHRHVG